jgi:hypothetical protein
VLPWPVRYPISRCWLSEARGQQGLQGAQIGVEDTTLGCALYSFGAVWGMAEMGLPASRLTEGVRLC